MPDSSAQFAPHNSSTPPSVPVDGGVTPRPQIPRGPETVINPEGRPISASPSEPTPGTVSTPSSMPASSLVRTLFPAVEDQAEQQPFPAPQGLTLGHFSIVERIRSGGMGAVFRAIDTQLNRSVALKILPPGQSRDLSAVQRFRNEAQAAAQLDHDNVARVFFFGEDQGLHFIAFEFVTGVNLRELIHQQKRLQVADAVNYTLQIASALLHTSAQGVVHRDIKPSNIIITPSGRAKLVDLGLARKETRNPAGADLTLAGTTLGTFDYISPEQARDPRTADVRSDIYSLGCTLYHMLTGEPPYPEGTVLQKLLQHQGDEAPDPAAKNRHVPENLSAIVRKMMAKDLRRRYSTAEQLVRDLMLVAGSMGLRSVSSEGLVWLAAPSSKTPFLERHLAWMATVAALLLIVGYLEYGNVRLPDKDADRNAGRQVSATQTAGATPPQAPSDAEGSKGTRSPSKSGRSSSGRSKVEPPRDVSDSGQDVPPQIKPVDTASRTSPRPTNPAKVPNLVQTVAEEELPSETPATATTSSPASGTDVVSLGPDFAIPADVLRPLAPTDTFALTVPQDSEDGGDTRPARSGSSTAGDSRRVENPRENGGVPAEAVPSPEVAIAIVDSSGAPGQSFRSLKAACAAAVDGNIIELRFNGRRREAPFTIAKTVTLRAAKGFRPVLEMTAAEIPGEGYQTRLITVGGGSVDIVGVELLMEVSETVPTDQWALFALPRPDYLRLQSVAITVENPKRRPAVVFEVQQDLNAGMPDMDIGKTTTRPPLGVEISNSFVRGTCDLFQIRHLGGTRILVKQAVVALDGTLLAERGSMELPAETPQVELRLDRVTAVLEGGLARLESGDLPRKLVPLQVSASDTIFSARTQDPLVSITGNAPLQDLRPLLTWNGRKNYYDRAETFLSIVSTEGAGKADSLDFPAWQKHWGSSVEVDPHSILIRWKRDWTAQPLTKVTASDFALSRTGSNQAVNGATNGDDAGANLAEIPTPYAAPEPNPEPRDVN